MSYPRKPDPTIHQIITKLGKHNTKFIFIPNKVDKRWRFDITDRFSLQQVISKTLSCTKKNIELSNTSLALPKKILTFLFDKLSRP